MGCVGVDEWTRCFEFPESLLRFMGSFPTERVKGVDSEVERTPCIEKGVNLAFEDMDFEDGHRDSHESR